jgi:hypothetical protein
MPEHPDLSGHTTQTLTVRCMFRTSRTKLSDLTAITQLVTKAIDDAFANQRDIDGGVIAVLLGNGRNDTSG